MPGFFLVVGWGLWDRRRAKPRPALPWFPTVLAFLLPLSLYLYLPLRSRHDLAVSWESLDTLPKFLVHVTARQYHGGLGKEGLLGSELNRFFTQQLPAEAAWIFLVLAGLGLGILLGRRSRFGLLSLVVAVPYLIYNQAYAVHDIQLYYLPVIAVGGVWAAVGAGSLTIWVSRRQRVGGLLVAILLLGACLLPLRQNWRQNDQSQFQLIHHYVRDILRHTEPNAVLFSSRWDSFCSPALYYQQVLAIRPDVVVLDWGLLAQPTLADRLTRRIPELAERCQTELAAVAEFSRLSAQGARFDERQARRQFELLKRKLLVEAVQLRTVYLTSDLFGRPFVSGFHLITEGLVARVAGEDVFRPSATEFLGPGVGLSGLRSRQERQIFADYVLMLRNRASYLEIHGQTEEAAELGRKMLQMGK
jgi:hypothetical protein